MEYKIINTKQTHGSCLSGRITVGPVSERGVRVIKELSCRHRDELWRTREQQCGREPICL